MPELARHLQPLVGRPHPADHPAAADGEPIGRHLVAQPLSAAASAAYLGAGWVLWRDRRSHDDPIGAACYAVAVGANGLGGIAFHGPGDRMSHWFHDAALCATLAAQAVRSSRRPTTLPVFLVVAGGAAALVAADRHLTNAVTGSLALVALARELDESRSGVPAIRGPMAVAAAAATTGVVLHRVARPTSRLHRPSMTRIGHAGWHLMSAIGLASWGWARRRPAKPTGGGEPRRG